jgi:hypothetical protein
MGRFPGSAGQAKNAPRIKKGWGRNVAGNLLPAAVAWLKLETKVESLENSQPIDKITICPKHSVLHSHSISWVFKMFDKFFFQVCNVIKFGLSKPTDFDKKSFIIYVCLTQFAWPDQKLERGQENGSRILAHLNELGWWPALPGQAQQVIWHWKSHYW